MSLNQRHGPINITLLLRKAFLLMHRYTLCTNLGVVTSFRNRVRLPQVATTADGFTGVTLRVRIFRIVYKHNRTSVHPSRVQMLTVMIIMGCLCQGYMSGVTGIHLANININVYKYRYIYIFLKEKVTGRQKAMHTWHERLYKFSVFLY